LKSQKLVLWAWREGVQMEAASQARTTNCRLRMVFFIRLGLSFFKLID
jgi:hypothetical protein